MKASTIVASALNLLVSLMILSLGMFFVSIPYIQSLQVFLVDILDKNSFIFLKIGLFFIVVSVFLIFSFYFIYKKQFIKINMKRNKTDIDTKIIASYIEEYLKKKYQNTYISTHINVLLNKKLEIIANFSAVKDQNNESLLEIEENIGKILFDQLNYEKEFVFTLNTN
ncbi:MAG: hypothetical protein K1060chlam5_00471 [Candidatus Anoxychlamydiales bacterium]|nr:hypothetical protein [Candidatus Anoxychlamydiales bacterium]